MDVIKVDKTFVERMCGGSEDATLVRSVLAIASELGLQVVTEGIEVDEQEAELRRLGRDLGECYLFAHPVSAARMDGVLGLVSALDGAG